MLILKCLPAKYLKNLRGLQFFTLSKPYKLCSAPIMPYGAPDIAYWRKAAAPKFNCYQVWCLQFEMLDTKYVISFFWIVTQYKGFELNCWQIQYSPFELLKDIQFYFFRFWAPNSGRIFALTQANFWGELSLYSPYNSCHTSSASSAYLARIAH